MNAYITIILNQDLTYHISTEKLFVLFLTDPKCMWMVYLQTLPHPWQFHTVFLFNFPFPSSIFCNQYYQHTSGKAVQLQKRSGNTFIACQPFFLTPMKGDMRKFSTDTICCNQLKFNLQIVQNHPISFLITLKPKKSLRGNFQCLPHSGTVWMIWNPESAQVAKAACSN